MVNGLHVAFGNKGIWGVNICIRVGGLVGNNWRHGAWSTEVHDIKCYKLHSIGL